MKALPASGRLLVGTMLLLGAACLAYGAAQGTGRGLLHFACLLLFALVASSLKVRLPGVTGTMSVVFLFILVAVQELNLAQVLLISCAGTVMQCFWRSRTKPRFVQVAFNIANMAAATTAAYLAYHWGVTEFRNAVPFILMATAAIFFVTNTVPVAAIIAITERKPAPRVWYECYFWSFPYYLVGAALAALIGVITHYSGPGTPILLLPVLYVMHRSHRAYLTRLEAEKAHVEEITNLQLRTIEALAMAIEAKDQGTHQHLQRVQVYALAIGKEMGLSEPEISALRAGAILHDIGKLAVPEHIISKPGKLSAEEFDKIKIHPLVGSEILERVAFPYPVVPVVRAHHERWDGSGYPSGLRGTQIPIGARILSVVDCFDALTSDRPYRRALTGNEAMRWVEAEAGKSFDPQVVKILMRLHKDLEKEVGCNSGSRKIRCLDRKIGKGVAPAAGFQIQGPSLALASEQQSDFLTSIAAARQEVQTLYELSQELGTSLRLEETLSFLSVRLKKLIRHDAIAIYVKKDDRLIPEFVSGENHRFFASLQIRIGEGLSGWVAANQKPIINGNPSAEASYLEDRSKVSTLSSALSIPLQGVNDLIGVLTLYHAEFDAFSSDHARILMAIESKLALAIENALKYRIAENCATTDYLTGLANARSLFIELDGKLAQCKRMGSPLTVMVCDLDGFKQVNDSLGHMVGNRVLRAIARRLKSICREYDCAARMGGDEFVLVLPGLGPNAVQEKAQHLRRLALEAGREVCGRKVLSLSIGYALYPADGNDAEALLAEADRRMYLEKQAHHNELYTSVALLPRGYSAAVVS